MKDSRKYILLKLIAFGLVVAGCSQFSAGSDVDAVRDSSGREWTADTMRNWEFWKLTTDRQIADELAGLPAPGFANWNEKWMRQIEALRHGRQNSERYIQYLQTERQRVGLPPLF